MASVAQAPDTIQLDLRRRQQTANRPFGLPAPEVGNVAPRRRSSLRAVIAMQALVVTSIGLPGQAAAQQVNLGLNGVPRPSDEPTIDANGVDVRSGKPSYEIKELLIGGDGIGALPYTESFDGVSRRTNFDNSLQLSSVYLSGATASITLGSIGEFMAGYVPEALDPTGSTLYGSEYTRKNGVKAYFTHVINTSQDTGQSSSVNLVDYMTYPNGVKWTYHYKDVPLTGLPQGNTYVNSRIQSVTSNTGYQIKFIYASNVSPTTPVPGDWARITSVVAINNAHEYCNPDADSCQLTMPWRSVGYSTSAGMSSITDSDGNQTLVTVSPLRVRLPGSATDDLNYTMQPWMSDPCDTPPYPGTPALISRISSANVGGIATTYTHTFNQTASEWTVTSSSSLSQNHTYKTKCSQRWGPQSQYRGTVMTGVLSHKDQLNRITNYEYQNTYTSNLTKVTMPEGNYTIIDRDGSGNAIQETAYPRAGTGLATIAVGRGYGPCSQLQTFTDARNNVWTFSYDPTHCGLLTEKGPAVNGVQPVKRYAYAQRYAWIKNSSGAYVQASDPVWLMVEERTCKTTATTTTGCAGGPADEVVTSIEYGPNSGPNNLQVRGRVVTADGVSLRTCYSYDIYGNKISETKPRAGLTSCS